jgi:hypothetical protein
MKKIYFTLSLLTLVFGAKAQSGIIQNGGFENWTNTFLFDYTTSWSSSNTDEYNGVPCVAKSTDHITGLYSAEITAKEIGTNPDTTFGYVFHGVVGGSGPATGIVYPSNFNEIRFKYKCDLPVGDSMFIIVFRYVGGVETEQIIASAAYGVKNVWTSGSVMVSANPQDELFLAFILGNPFSGTNPTPNAWARIEDVQMFNAGTLTTALPDPSFESWSAQNVENPASWFTMNELFAGTPNVNALKTTDFNTGAYALEMKTLMDPNGVDTVQSFVSVGPIVFNGFNPFTAVPYNANPTTFSGNYKYVANNGDQGWINATFYQAGVNIGAVFQGCVANANYVNFSLPITLAGTPDSVSIVCFSGDNPGSVLKVDDLAFSGGNVSLDEFSASKFSMYPNPATDNVMLKADGIYSYEIVSVLGAVIASSENMNGAISVDISKFSAGSYYVNIKNASISETHQLIVR